MHLFDGMCAAFGQGTPREDFRRKVKSRRPIAVMLVKIPRVLRMIIYEPPTIEINVAAPEAHLTLPIT